MVKPDRNLDTMRELSAAELDEVAGGDAVATAASLASAVMGLVNSLPSGMPNNNTQVSMQSQIGNPGGIQKQFQSQTSQPAA